MELALDGYGNNTTVNVFKVSILVFVELALDENSAYVTASGDMGFNPCFRGTCS